MNIITNSQFANKFNIQAEKIEITSKQKGENFKEFILREGTELIKKKNQLTVINIYKNHREIININDWEKIKGKSIHSLTCILWIDNKNNIKHKFIKTRIRFAYMNKVADILTDGIQKIVGSWTNIFGLPIYEIKNIYQSIYIKK